MFSSFTAHHNHCHCACVSSYSSFVAQQNDNRDQTMNIFLWFQSSHTQTKKKKKKRNTPFLMEIFFFKIVTKKITKNCEYCIEEHVRAHMHTHAKFIKKTVAKNSGFLFVFPNSCNCFQKKTHTRIFFFERRTLLCESVLHKESLFHLPHKFVSFFAITHKTKTLFFLACLGTFATREELGNSWKIFTWF